MADLIVLWPLAGTTIVQWIIRLYVLIILCQMNIFDKNLICIWILYIKGTLKTELFSEPFGPVFFSFVPSVCICIVCFYSFISFIRSSHFPLVRYQRVNKTAWNANASNRIISCMFWRILHTIQNNRDIDRKYLYKVFILKTTNVLHEHRSFTLLLIHSLSICVLISFGKQMNSSCYSLCAMWEMK